LSNSCPTGKLVCNEKRPGVAIWPGRFAPGNGTATRVPARARASLRDMSKRRELAALQITAAARKRRRWVTCQSGESSAHSKLRQRLAAPSRAGRQAPDYGNGHPDPDPGAPGSRGVRNVPPKRLDCPGSPLPATGSWLPTTVLPAAFTGDPSTSLGVNRLRFSRPVIWRCRAKPGGESGFIGVYRGFIGGLSVFIGGLSVFIVSKVVQKRVPGAPG